MHKVVVPHKNDIKNRKILYENEKIFFYNSSCDNRN